MKSSPSAPPAPDYVGAANAQGSANKDAAMTTAVMGNPNVYSPYGMQTVSYDPTGPDGQYKPTVTQTLNPQSQAIFDAQQEARLKLSGLGNSAAETAGKVLGSGFDPGAAGVPGVQTGLDTSGVARMPVNAGTTAQDAIMSRLEPQLNRRREQLTNRLLNEGHVRGNEAYDNAMRDNAQNENDMLLQAGKEGIGVDMAANNQGFNQAVQGGQFGNTAQAQAMAQALYQRNLPLNEIAALMSGSQIQNPQFGGYNGANVAAPNFQQIAGQQGQWDQGIYNAGVGRANAGNSNMASLGAAALMAFSDRRLKSNVERVGTHALGIGIYEYDIFGERQRGVMADEVERVLPEAVHMHPSGYAMVNYALIGRV